MTERRVVGRGARVSLVVGTVLAAINQGDLLLSGQVTAGVVAKIILTYSVPFCVSVYAGTEALREQLSRGHGASD